MSSPISRFARACGLGLVLAPFVFVAMALRLAVPRVADRVARKAVTLVAAVPVAPRFAEPAPLPQASPRESVAPPDPPAPPVRRAPRSWSPSRFAATPVARSPEPARGRIVIGPDRALEIAPRLRGVRAVTVRDAQGRPAGAGLSGVAGLGVGLDDGDVVTSIAGRPTPTAEEALSAALGAYGSGAREIRGTIAHRGGDVDVAVEIPVVR